MRLAENSVVDGRYLVMRQIGSGGMADVWIAHDKQLDRPVALKILHDRFAQDREFVERFRREASSAAGLQHPNVVGIFDRGEVDGTYYIAMQLVEGHSLKELIDRGLPVPEALRIVREILAAARFAHSNGIVHRDLKPHNVLVDREGRVMVTDFGIARAGPSEITQTGSVMGTAQYLSPEQAQGLAVTPASDIYSIGVILYEMLTKRVPFEGDSAVAIALKQVSEQPQPPSRLNPEVTRALDSVVLKALAKDPANRFADADEFLRALDAAEARPTQAVDQTQAFAAVVPPPAPPAEEPPAPPAPEPAPADEPEPDPSRRRRLIALALLAALLAGVVVWALTRPGQVPVPEVATPGTTVDEARLILESQGFEVVEEGEPNEAPRNQVLETNPPSGAEVDEGSTVTVFYSEGPGSAKVPDVIGLDRQDAVDEIEDAGFGARIVERFSPRVEAGRVIGTNPPAGARLDLGSAVTVVVSRGADTVEVPDVTGQSEGAAVATLERLDFIVNVDTAESDIEAGTVFEQSPLPGSSEPRGAEITIVVSEGPGTVTVPDVVGRDESAAIAALTNAGLDVEVQRGVETDDPGQDGEVVDQFPGGGTEARPGDEVTIQVAEFVEPEPEPEPEPTTTTTTTGGAP